MEDCRICGNPEIEGYLYIYNNSRKPNKIGIKEEDKFKLHQHNNHTKQDVLSKFVIRGLEEVASVSRFHGHYCAKCWQIKFGRTHNCIRCGKSKDLTSSTIYNVVNKDSLEIDVSDLERGNLSYMKDAVNRSIESRAGWVCSYCAESLFNHEDLFNYD